MFGTLLRILTCNYFFLGFIFKPKWKRERSKVKGNRWNLRLTIKMRSGQDVKDLEPVLKESIPWFSPKEIKQAILLLAKGKYCYLWLTSDDHDRLMDIDIPSYCYVEHHFYDCCGGEWRRGECSCLISSAADYRLPIGPQKDKHKIE